jgi:hypothetical protein
MFAQIKLEAMCGFALLALLFWFAPGFGHYVSVGIAFVGGNMAGELPFNLFTRFPLSRRLEQFFLNEALLLILSGILLWLRYNYHHATTGL